MMQLEVGGRRIPVATGETVIGSAPWCAIVLTGEGVRPHHAVVQGTAQGTAAIRSVGADVEVTINGIRLGTDPTPVLHGDKIQIFGHEILAVDPQRAGNTQLFDSGAFADLPPIPAKPSPGPSGGRVVCLTDGREYTMGVEPLVFGRDAASDVVVSGSEVSRRHAEIRAGPNGYELHDFSSNGTFVNGRRVQGVHPLARADVIRIGTDEFRFYADAAPPAPPLGPRPVPPEEALRTPTGATARLSDTMHGLPVPTPADSTPTPPSTPAAAPIASLLVRSGDLRGRRLPITLAMVNVGRADYNDIVIQDPSVSTTHAKLQLRDDVWVLTDLGSTNGTYVEGEAVTGDTALSPGTTIRFGEVAVLFEPLDEPARGGRQRAAAGREPQEAPAAVPQPVAEPRPIRRPIRAAAPKPAGPPFWLFAVIVLAVVLAIILLTSS